MDRFVSRATSVWQSFEIDDITATDMQALFCYNPSSQWLQSIFLHGIDLDWITR
jgi:hypothetical protein